MKKSEIIENFAKRLIDCDSEIFAEIEVEKIVKEINSMTHHSTKKHLSNKLKIDILKETKERLKVQSLEESQESEYLMNSFTNVLDYLKPAVEIINKTIDDIRFSKNVEGHNYE